MWREENKTKYLNRYAVSSTHLLPPAVAALNITSRIYVEDKTEQNKTTPAPTPRNPVSKTLWTRAGVHES